MMASFSLARLRANSATAISIEQRALSAFRFSAALLIAVFCAVQSAEPAARAASSERAANTLTSIICAWLHAFDAGRVWQLAAALALAVAVGLAPRWTALALLLVLGASSVPEAANVDLAVTTFFALWLVVLPSGLEAAPSRPKIAAHASAQRPLAVQFFLVHIAVLYVNPALFRLLDASWQPLSVLGVMAAAVPGLMVLDRGGWPRIAVIIVQIIMHAVLARAGHIIVHALFASTTILSFSLLRRPAEERPAAPLAPFDGHAACAVGLSCIAATTIGAQILHGSDQLAVAREILHDLGGLGALYSLR